MRGPCAGSRVVGSGEGEQKPGPAASSATAGAAEAVAHIFGGTP